MVGEEIREKSDKWPEAFMGAAETMAVTGRGYQGKPKMAGGGYRRRDFIGMEEEMSMRTMFPEESSLGSGKANNTLFREKKMGW